MKKQFRGSNREAEKRKKILIFVGLCIATTVVITLCIVLVHILKSDNEEEKKIKAVRVFTNLGYVGHSGPEGTMDYKGTALEKEVELVDGVQLWEVPFTGIWYFEVYGASGGDGLYAGHNQRLHGGQGAKLTGKLFLKEGQVLKILVGHEGTRDHLTQFRVGSGGGGTFLVSAKDKPIMVAAGGGGGGVPVLGRYTEGGPGTKEHRGKMGKGGKLYDPRSNITVKTVRIDHDCQAGAGGGFHGDGAGYLKGWGGKAFIHGGSGGFIKKRVFSVTHGTHDNGYDKGGANGGFGGGGASGLLPGGGGGFFGGDVHGAYLYEVGYKKAHGGKSYNQAMYPTTTPGVHRRHGRVYAKYLGPNQLTYNANQTTDPRIPKTKEQWYADSE